MKPSAILSGAAVLLCLGGAYLSHDLLAGHLPGGQNTGWLHAFCEADDGVASCDKVLSSRWGVFPPRAKDAGAGADAAAPDDDAGGGVSVAYLGLAYFTLLGTWYVLVGRPSPAGRRYALFPLVVNSLGLLGSIGFVVVMATLIGTWCPLCTAVHALNLLLFAVTVGLWLGRPRPETETSGQADGVEHGTGKAAESKPPAHPSPRVVLAALALATALMAAEYQQSVIAGLRRDNTKLTAITDEVRSSVESLLALFKNTPQQEIAIRPDDPIRYDQPDVATLVIWSDFECSHCREFNRMFETRYRKDFDGAIRLVFKHFPTNSDCNRFIQDKPHPNACITAAFAEAARQLSGDNETFWKAHDFFFDAQARFKDLNSDEVARDLGLDPAAVHARMGSREVGKRIFDDVEQGFRLGVTSTPGVFLDGRRIGALARDVPGFWRALGKMYREARERRTEGS